jgi:hypothetical protein
MVPCKIFFLVKGKDNILNLKLDGF